MKTGRLIILIPFLGVLGLILYAGRFDRPLQTRTFRDRHDRVIGTLNPSYNGLQIWTPLREIPREIVAKTLRQEDRFFYWHRGINPVALLKAAFENAFHGRIIRGGSTITQQLARNLIQEKEGRSSGRTWGNKVRETLVALGLEMRHGKAWILERYLNTIYYGARCYGVAAAAYFYEGKSLAELSEADADRLVALPKAPNRLQKKSVPSMNLSGLSSGRHFMEYVSERSQTGPVTRTTLDASLQAKLEEAVRTTLENRAAGDPKLTGAVVVIEVATGDILAMVGSRDYFNEAIDGAVNGAVALRQPGSALKPFTYYAAFGKGYSPTTRIADEPVNFHVPGNDDNDGYAPQNFDRRFHGPVTVREALANSYNVPAVTALNDIGLSYYHDILKRFGFVSLNRPPPHYGLAVTLGAGEVTLLELTNAYAALARGGMFRPDQIVLGKKSMAAVPIGPDAAAFALAMTDILSDPKARLKAFGFNEDLTVEGRTVAVKTGTSYEHRDNWTVGYTPSYAVGVWVGHADGTSLNGTTGASGAGPVWHAAMEALLRGTPDDSFPKLTLQMTEPAENESNSPPAGPVGINAREWKVLSPVANSRFRLQAYLPREHQKILAKVSAARPMPLTWSLDGQVIGRTQEREPRLWILPQPGRHRLEVASNTGDRQAVSFYILENEQ